jgi:CBS domain-containing protein
MRHERYESPVATAPTTASVRELAAKMEDYGLGSVVILDQAQRPIGIVTDRDLAMRVIAEGKDPDGVIAADVMSKPLLAASPDEPLETLVERMAAGGIRRLPVVRDERLVGIVASDDLLLWLGREVDDIGEATRREVTEGWEVARRRRQRRSVEERLGELAATVEQAREDARDFVSREVDTLRDRLSRLLGGDQGRG